MSKTSAARTEHDSVKPGKQARIYKQSQTVDHDLFKLLPASMRKNVSFTDRPIIERFEHCHIFHTIDSNGKHQDACNAVGGHFHFVKVSGGRDGIPSVEVSTAMKWVNKRVRGNFVREAVPAGAFQNEDGKWINDPESEDNHTHEAEYRGSEKITLRQPSMEWAKTESEIRSRTEPGSVAGVIES